MAPIKDFVEKFIQRAAKRRKAIEDGAADSSNPNNPLTVPLSLNSSNLSQTSATPSCRPLFSQLPYGSEKLRKVFDYLKSQCGTDEGKLVQEFADAWFYAVADSVTECEHRVDMLKFLIELLGEECLERKFSVSVLKSTQHQIRDQLDAQTVIKLCSFYGEDFKNGKSKDNRWLDVVSALVQKLSDFKEVKWQWEGESQTTMTGAEAQKCFLKQLLAESGGCNKSLRHALTVLKDCGCAGNETRAEFVEKLLKQLGESATSKELVATTLQLLALTSKTECATVVEKVCDGFLRLESAYRPATDVVADSAAPGEEGAHRGLMLKQYRELMEGEATALLAALESIRLDVQMARSLFTSVKAKGLRLLASSFSVATMLSLTQVSRFRSLAMHEMKSLATRLCREQKRLDDCNWLKNQLAHQPLPDLKSVLIGLVEFRYSSMDWMMALGDSLIDFGFILLDTHVNKLRIVGGRISDSSADGSNAVAALGKWLVFQCFMSDESACPGILDRLIDSITKRNLKIEAWYSIDLLAMLVSKCPMQVLSCKKRLLDTLSSITVFNSISAIPLLSALMPVIVKSPDLRTKFLDTLKTAMLSHGVDSLKTAVSGFLIFLRNYRTPSGSKPNALVAREDELSQTFPTFSSQLMHDVSQQIRAVLPRESGKSNRGKNYDALCLEAISCLKRCFYQSAETRIGLYKGLVDLVRKNNMLLDPAIDMLLTHLRSFIADTGSKPIITDKIVVSLKDRLIPMEPLGELLRALHRCVWMYVTSIKRQKGKTSTQHEESTYDGALHQTQLAAFVNLSQIVGGGGGGGGLSSQPNALAVDQTVVKRVNALLRTLAERMADCALEDLEVDKTTDFSAGTTIGLRNAHLAVMFLGVFESLMEHAWWFMNPFSNGADLLLNLFANRSKLLAVLKEKSVSLSNLARKEAADGKKAGAKLSTARVTSNLLLNTLTDMLTKLCCDKKPRHHEGIKKLRDDKEFISWVLESIGDKVTRWQRATEAGLVGDQHEADALQNFVQLAGMLLKFYFGSSADLVEELSKTSVDNMNSWKTTAISIYGKILALIFFAYPAQHIKTSLATIWKMVNESRAMVGSETSLKDVVMSHFELVATKMLTSRLHMLAKLSEDDKKKKQEMSKQCIVLVQILRSFSTLLVPVDHSGMLKLLENIVRTQIIYDSGVAKELWKVYTEMCVQGDWSNKWMRIISAAAVEVDNALAENAENDATSQMLSVTSQSAEAVAQVLIDLTETWLKSSRYIIERFPTAITAETDERAAVICAFLDNVSDTVRCLLPVHTDHAKLKETIVRMLTIFFETLQIFVKFLVTCAKPKSVDISEWKTLLALRRLVQGNALKVMELADPTVGLLQPEDEDRKLSHSRKFNKAVRDQTLYVTYVRMRERYHVEILLLSRRLDDDELDVTVKNNTIGVRDFRLDTKKIKAKVAEMLANPDSDDLDDAERQEQQERQEGHLDVTRDREPTPPPLPSSRKRAADVSRPQTAKRGRKPSRITGGN